MSPRKPSRCIALIGLVILGTTLLASGRVFLRWGARMDSNRAIEVAGGCLLYEASVEINGGRGSLSVAGFNSPIEQVVGSFKKTFDAEGFVFRNGTMGHAIIPKQGGTIRFIISELNDPIRTIAFKLEQSLSAVSTSQSPLKRHIMSEIKEFPGSTPEFYAANDNTRASLSISTAASTPADVRGFYDDALQAEGWTPVTDKTAGVGVYVRGAAICCISAYLDRENDTCQIALLHKHLEI